MVNEKTLTIFRKYKDSDIIALFPNEKHNDMLCMSYMHIGQHGGADYHGTISITRPATPEEYHDLKVELESIGYTLKIRKKWVRSR